MIGILCIVIITILLPPLGVFFISGCGADLLINICLTLLGYFPGHIHAFYLEYVYYKRKENPGMEPAPGVYSQNIQSGGQQQYAPVAAQPQQHYGTVGTQPAPVK